MHARARVSVARVLRHCVYSRRSTSLSHAPSHAPSLSRSHALTLSLTLTRSYPLSLTHSLTHSLSRSLSHTLSLSRSLSLSLSQSPSHSYSLLLSLHLTLSSLSQVCAVLVSGRPCVGSATLLHPLWSHARSPFLELGPAPHPLTKLPFTSIGSEPLRASLVPDRLLEVEKSSTLRL